MWNNRPAGYQSCLGKSLFLWQGLLQLTGELIFVARDMKHRSISAGSEVDDGEGKSSQDNDLEKMTVPKPKADKGEESDSDDAFDDRTA